MSYRSIRVFVLLLLLPLSNLRAQQVKAIYVAVNGKSNSEGSKQKPVNCLSIALVRAMQAAKNKNLKEVHIVLRGGIYPVKTTVEIVQGKTWNSTIPLIIEADSHAHVTLHGGKIIDLRNVKPVTDTAYLNRFYPTVRRQVKEVDLGIAGVDKIGKPYPVGYYRPLLPAWTEAFFNHTPGGLARWPNKGTVLIDSVIDAGAVPRNGDYTKRGGIFRYKRGVDRVSKWQQPQNAFLSGYFNWGYANDNLPVKSIDTIKRLIEANTPTMYGVASGTPWRAWYAYNLPEEIDQQMEYYIDADKKKLYFLPPDNLKSVEVSELEEPMMALEGVKNVTIRNIQFTCSRGMGIYMERTEGVAVKQCSFSNLGMMAISMGRGIEPFKNLVISGTGQPASLVAGGILPHIYDNTAYDRQAGFNNEISDCEIYQTGAGGIFLSGGDRFTLKPGGNAVKNCYIHDFNRINQSYCAGIWITGVGNTIANCEIFNAPSMAILLNGNNHVIEYNNIHHVDLEVDDQGALYFGRNPSERGIVVRYNYFHNLGGTHTTNAVYHDDGACGMAVYGNVFYKTGTFGALIGGGSDNPYTNNIFIDIPYALHIDKRLANWAKSNLNKGGLYETRLNLVKYNLPPYSIQYPELKNYWEDTPATPKRDLFSKNILVNIKHLAAGDSTLLVIGKDNLRTNDLGIFKNAKKEDFNLQNEAEIESKIPGFKPIPVNKIGYHAASK
ncbi:MAG: right-handed parallel beta-helix repeat-containing protein [Mucilaginibacter sp.]